MCTFPFFFSSKISKIRGQKNKKASLSKHHSSRRKDKKIIHLYETKINFDPNAQKLQTVALRNMEERSRSAMDLSIEYSDKEGEDGEVDDSEDESAGTSRAQKRSFFRMHFDSLASSALPYEL
jgi:hypothetical protein